jgi:acetyl esterase/lipase
MMGRLTRGTPLAVILVVVGLVGLWVLNALRDEGPDIEVPPGNGPAYIWGDPAGDFEGEPPKAVLMVVHGGGWEGTDRVQLERAAGLAVRSQELGYATMAVDYRAGAKGLIDLRRFYGEARGRAGTETPVCAIGESAGGHLSLLLAQREPGLDCVIANVAPTDLPALAESGASNGALAARIAADAFGSDALERFSPALHPDSTDADVFLLYSENDTLVAPEQGEAMQRALPQSTLMVLGPGDQIYGHITPHLASQGLGVDGEQLDEARAAEIAFLDDVAARARG